MHIRWSLLGYLLLVLVLVGATGSCMSPQKALKKGHKKFELGEYYKAKPLFKQARRLKSKAGRAEANFYLGECNRYLLRPKRAEVAYHHAVRYQYHDSIAILRLAQSMQTNEDYTEAMEKYKVFLNLSPDHKVALNGLRSCEQLTELKRETPYKVIPFKIFNSSKSDFRPDYGNQQYSTVYFTTNRNGVQGTRISGVSGTRYSDIYFSRLNIQGEWSKPEPVESDVNSIYDDGAPTFTEGGQQMFFTRCAFDAKASLGASIMVAKRTGVRWGSPKKVEILPDSIADTTLLAHPAISQDGEILYFVSDMAGGFGGKDIWKVHKTKDGWSRPINLGGQINTAGDEMFPYVRSEGVLYFSSDGHVGIGGLDIYKAVWDEDRWKISNLGIPINSARDDFGICFEGDLEKGFFSSNRKSVRGYDNIYRFEQPYYEVKLFGDVKDSRTYDPVSSATVRLVGNDGTNELVPVRKSGRYTSQVNTDAKYVFLVSARGYLNQRGGISTEGLREDKDFRCDINLVSISRPVVLENVFYDFGSWDLKELAKAALDSLVLVLEDNPKITIEISSHTDMVGDSIFNMELSQKRAQGVVDYLISQGVDPERLKAVGYGENVPVLVTEAIHKEYKFLYPGEVLDSVLLNKLLGKQKEVANQINRRTEFKVLKTNYKKK